MINIARHPNAGQNNKQLISQYLVAFEYHCIEIDPKGGRKI